MFTRRRQHEHPLAPRLRDIGDLVPNLGYGGCGHLALAVHMKLPESEIWVVSPIDLDTRDPDWSRHAAGPVAHAACWHDGYFLDCRGSHRRLCRTGHEIGPRRFYRRVDADVMRSWLRFRRLWNEEFDRSNLSKMKRLVDRLPIPRTA